MKIRHLFLVLTLAFSTHSTLASTSEENALASKFFKTCKISYFYDQVSSSKKSIIEHYCRRLSVNDSFIKFLISTNKKLDKTSDQKDQDFYQIVLRQCEGTASPKVDVDSFELSYKLYQSLPKATCTKTMFGMYTEEASDATVRFMMNMSDEDFEKSVSNAISVFEYCMNPYIRSSSPARDKLLLQKAFNLAEAEFKKMSPTEQQRLLNSAKNIKNGNFDPNYCDFHLTLMRAVINYKGYDRTDIISAMARAGLNK